MVRVILERDTCKEAHLQPDNMEEICPLAQGCHKLVLPVESYVLVPLSILCLCGGSTLGMMAGLVVRLIHLCVCMCARMCVCVCGNMFGIVNVGCGFHYC